MSNEIEKPLSKTELYLKACCEGCGCANLPAPETRNEDLLYQLAEKLAGITSNNEE